MILNLLKRTLHLVLIFSIISLHTQASLAMEGSDSESDLISRRPPPGEGGAGVFSGADEEAGGGAAYPVGSFESIDAERAQQLKNAFRILRHDDFFFGVHQFKIGATIVPYDPTVPGARVDYTIDPVKFSSEFDKRFFLEWCEQGNQGSCFKCLTNLRNILASLGILEVLGVVPFVATATYSVGNLLGIPIDGFGEGLSIIVYMSLLAPSLARAGYDRMRDIYLHFKGRGFSHKGNEYDSIPKLNRLSFKHKIAKAGIFLMSLVYALEYTGVFALKAENQDKPMSEQDSGDRLFAIVFSPIFELIMTEIYYRIGSRALQNAFHKIYYAGADSNEQKRKIILASLQRTRIQIAKDSKKEQRIIGNMYNTIIALKENLPRPGEEYQQPDLATTYPSMFSILLMKYRHPAVEFGEARLDGEAEHEGELSINESTPLRHVAVQLEQERDDFARKFNRLSAVVMGHDLMTEVRGWWSGISSRLSDTIMGVGLYFGFRTLEYITQGLLVAMGMSAEGAEITANIFSAIAAGSITYLTWEEVRTFFREIPQAFNRSEDYWGARLPFKLNSVFNATILALVEIVSGQIVFASDPAPARYFLLGTNFFRSFAIYFRFFNRNHQNLLTGIVTRNIDRATTVRKKRAVLNYWLDKAEELIPLLEPNTIDQLHTNLLQYTKED